MEGPGLGENSVFAEVKPQTPTFGPSHFGIFFRVRFRRASGQHFYRFWDRFGIPLGLHLPAGTVRCVLRKRVLKKRPFWRAWRRKAKSPYFPSGKEVRTFPDGCSTTPSGRPKGLARRISHLARLPPPGPPRIVSFLLGVTCAKSLRPSWINGSLGGLQNVYTKTRGKSTKSSPDNMSPTFGGAWGREAPPICGLCLIWVYFLQAFTRFGGPQVHRPWVIPKLGLMEAQLALLHLLHSKRLLGPHILT